jgi:uncharacterized membrane protein YidH (DUF202 family)
VRALGFVLIIIGLIALIYGGITWTQREEVLDFGPFEVATQERRTLPLPPVIGAVCLAGGIVLVVAGGRRRAA